MQRYGKLISACIAAAAMFGVAAAYAGDDELNVSHANLENGKKIFTEGKGTVPACNSCHGPEGFGMDAMGTPRLAGQGVQYLVKQLTDFGSDKRQSAMGGIMNANAKGLSVQDRVDVATFLSKMTAPDKASNLAELAAGGTAVGQPYLGKGVVLYGIPEKGVPACTSCHGYNGRGVAPVYPQIGRQAYNYLVNQLNSWRDGSRANDPMGQMRKVAQKLSDDDIRNAAAYLTAASPSTIGNGIVPGDHAKLSYDPH